MPVYFIQDGPGGAIKIGVTAGSPQVRLSALQTGNPRRLELLASIPGSSREEAALHERFAALRIQGEWFRADDRLLGFIDGLRYVCPQEVASDIATEVYGLSEDQTMVMLGIAEAAILSCRARAVLSDAETARGIMSPSELLVAVTVRGELEYAIQQRRAHTHPYGAGRGAAGATCDESTLLAIEAALDRHHDALAEQRLAESCHLGINPDLCVDWIEDAYNPTIARDDVPADEVF